MFEKKEIINAMTGKTIIWEVKPTSKGFGNKKRLLKLPEVKDKPTPSIINASMLLNNMPRNEYEEWTMYEIWSK